MARTRRDRYRTKQAPPRAPKHREENQNGLSYSRWRAAATIGARWVSPEVELIAAWKRGECPCDWAFEHQVRKGR